MLQKIELDEAEKWREYDWGTRVYRINDPICIYYHEGGTTHRVVDLNGVVHLVPAPGHMDCVVRFEGRVIA